MTDRFSRYTTTPEAPARDAIAITPSSSILTQTTRALYVGGTGNVAVQMAGYGGANGSIVTFVAVQAGSVLPLRVDYVFANTTATSILGLY